MSTTKDQGHVIGGLKAAISNPNTSEEAKERAAERLEEMGESAPAHQELGTHQIAGYKATITNPNTSEEAKQHAREVLETGGGEKPEKHARHSPTHSPHDEHTKRVLAGYKAALHNANVSDEAKERAKDFLRDHGEDV
ncbi:hypothetical protein BJ322DRAFT_73687 [Thelephora terrestris]|uniref:Conidiation-specific protein 6 n=1 Tax=Thelephora terrestris TaxID=56493 RepID=A0A9P6HVF2_9AGAM|nr:hypothetical protein BJ322DRAFT_73687 [Thelephora terrestris]